jgi:hypothetical protein
MKAEIIETKKQFEPIEIKLVIESEEQLCDLWHRLNIGRKIFESPEYANKNELKYLTDDDSLLWLWEELEVLTVQKGLKA